MIILGISKAKGEAPKNWTKKHSISKTDVLTVIFCPLVLSRPTPMCWQAVDEKDMSYLEWLAR